MKMHQRKFRLDIKRRFFTEKAVGHWKRVPREMVAAPSPSEFQEDLEDAFGHMV